MERTADYSIQGFLYQFNKTLLEVLKSGDGAEITIEGIVEDIEIKAPAGLTAIQCKYHEAKDTFTPSTIYKPLLQMMQHFQANTQANISYILFAHFPNPPTDRTITKTHLEEAINSTNKDLKKHCDALRETIDHEKFLARFSLTFGPGFDELVALVHAALLAAGIAKTDIENLAYPNAIQGIAALSIKHDASQRRITKAKLLDDLKKIKSTAITRWTLALKTRKQILEAKRRQLKLHLDKNARLRYFLVDCKSLEDFDAGIVGFTCDFLDKYHFKAAHICTPLLCLDTTDQVFRDIQLRLHKKGVVATDGFIGSHFDESYFFRQPLSARDPAAGKPRREFLLRILRWETRGSLLAQQKPDDLFILGSNGYSSLDTKDVSVEVLDASTIKEIAYITGVTNTYE